MHVHVLSNADGCVVWLLAGLCRQVWQDHLHGLAGLFTPSQLADLHDCLPPDSIKYVEADVKVIHHACHFQVLAASEITAMPQKPAYKFKPVSKYIEVDSKAMRLACLSDMSARTAKFGMPRPDFIAASGMPRAA